MSIYLQKYIRDLEEVSCNACGLDDGQVISERERFGLPIKSVICRGCGLMYLNPRPTKALYDEFNKADYRKAVSGTDAGIDRLFHRQKALTVSTIIPFCRKGMVIAPESVLDIGCSYGGIGGAFAEVYPGLEAVGLEPVIGNVEYANKHTKMKVSPGLFEDYEVDKKFDLAIFAQALNHTLDPKGNLEKIRSYLKPGGMLFISLQDTVSALLNRSIERMPEMTHPYMFCRESIHYLLSQAGYKVEVFEDNLLDAKSLSEKYIWRLSFPRMLILAKPISGGSGIEKPDFEEILGRVNRNQAFYEKWKHTIDQWQQPNLARRVYRRALAPLGGR